MGLSSEERIKVAQQLTKIASFLEGVRPQKKKAMALPNDVEQAVLDAPAREVNQIKRDVEIVLSKADEMIPALRRLTNRLVSKIRLPWEAPYMKDLGAALSSLDDLKEKIQALEAIGV